VRHWAAASRRQRWKRQIARSVWVGLHCLLLWLSATNVAQASFFADRFAQFPDWHKPAVPAAKGDLVYPDWFAGDWTVTTTLVDLVAPLAPEVTTPGFESNRAYLSQPVVFQVRFVPASTVRRGGSPTAIVSDRAYNGQNLAKAYLGDRAVFAVKVDPNNPNRQITLLRGDRQLVSTVTARAIEAPDADQFLTTEVFQQEFRGAPQLYFNQVETTTAYRHDAGASLPIAAVQVTAIYLSPQDRDYFKAGDRPVALYRYRLEFEKSSAASLAPRATLK
jgi:hypothetical protein